MRPNTDLTQGKILPTLLRFALPVLLAILLQTMYGAADLLIVGQFGQTAEVSAVATGSGVMQAITSAVVGLAVGTTVLLGQKLGEGKKEEAGSVVGVSITLFAGVGIAIALGMQLAAPAVTRWMRAPQEAFSSTEAYVRICSGGAVFIVAYNVLGSIFRGMGDSRMPLITVAVACVLNVLGDLLMVAVFRMGATGAALATVAAQAASVLLSVLFIRRKKLPFAFGWKNLRWDWRLAGRIAGLGVPIALQGFMVNISFMVITAIINTLGVTASAGVGVAERICGFIMLVPAAYMQAMSAFVAQNVGAQKPQRAKKALAYSVLTSLGVGVVLAYVSFFHGDVVARFFAKDPAVVLAAADYLKAYAADCLLVCLLFCLVGYFNGHGKTVFVMVQGIIGAFCVRIPVSYLMSRIAPVSLFRVGLATPMSTALQIALCGLYLWWLNRAARQPNGAAVPGKR
ncbi:MAG: MATE family efflux transporter [Eubacteriales bacterium]|nr:MATE family efflux transporter [Eubacteriales bacterium]